MGMMEFGQLFHVEQLGKLQGASPIALPQKHILQNELK